MDREKKIEALPYRERLDLTLEDLLFIHPLFEDAPLAGWEFFEKLARERYPFNFSIAPPEDLRMSNYEWRYHEIVKHLKKLQGKDTDLCQLLIARWLKQEKVCEPRQFLSGDVRRRLIKKFHKRRRISPNDLRFGAMVHTWVPYFERIKDALQAGKHLERVREEVLKLGYEPKAIGWVSKTRSTVQAVCGWLAERRNCEARTLRNIYSRQYGKADRPLI
jgi:hypothetical protein